MIENSRWDYVPIASWHRAFKYGQGAYRAYNSEPTQPEPRDEKQLKEFYDKRRGDIVKCVVCSILCIIPIVGNAILFVYAVFFKKPPLSSSLPYWVVADINGNGREVCPNLKGNRRRIFKPALIKRIMANGPLSPDELEKNPKGSYYWKPKDKSILDDNEMDWWGPKKAKDFGWGERTNKLCKHSQNKRIRLSCRANSYSMSHFPRLQISIKIIKALTALSDSSHIFVPSNPLWAAWAKTRFQTETDEQAELLFLEKLKIEGYADKFKDERNRDEILIS